VSPEKLIGYVRDAGCVLLGLGGIAWQIYNGHPTALGMGTCMGLLGYTGGIRAWQLRPTSKPGGRGRSSPRAASGSPSPSHTRSDGEQ
jgi:hypothetical protein